MTIDWSDYWQLQQGDKYGGYNCSAYCLAAGLKVANNITTTGARVRALSNEPVPDPKSPGLNHEQLQNVAAKFGVNLTVKYRVPWAEVLDISAAGHPMVLGVSYSAIRATPYTGQPTFYGNHELLLMPGHLVFDPLADGRRDGIYRGPGVYPDNILRVGAGLLLLRPGVRLGAGLAYIAIFPNRIPSPTAPDTGTGTVPRLVTSAPTPAERNVMIASAYPGHVMRLVKGQPLFRYPGGPVVTRMSAAGAVEHCGSAGSGWSEVKVMTGAPYADHKVRPTGLYVPNAAGPII